MSDIFTDAEIALFDPFEKVVEEPSVVNDNINANNVLESCPEGFERIEGECIEKVKITSTTPDTVVEDVEVPISESDVEEVSLELREYTYEDLLLEEKTEKDITIFKKNYKPKITIDDVGKNIEESVKEEGYAMFSYLMNNNSTLKNELAPNALMSIREALEEERDKINSKYDLNNPDQLLKAQEEFTTIFNEKMDSELNKSDEYKQIINIYQEQVGKEMYGKTRGLTRKSLGLGDEETQGYVTSFFEGAADFLGTDIPQNILELQDMYKGELLAQDENNLNLLKEDLKSGKINKDDRFGDINQRDFIKKLNHAQMKGIGKLGENPSIQDVVDFFEKDIGDREKNIDLNLKELHKLEWRQQWAKQAKIADEDGLTLSDVATMAGKQILQLPLAYFTGGLSAALQETAGNYGRNLRALAVKEYDLQEGEKPTDEQLIRLMREGKDDKIISITTGIAAGFLEYIGAKKAITATLFGKGMVSSFLRDGFTKQLGKSALQTGVASLESGFYESITETGQAGLSQIGESIVGSKNAFNFEEIFESAGQGFVIGTLFPLAGGAARQTMTEYRTTAALISAKYGNDKYGEALYKQLEAGVNEEYERSNSEEELLMNEGLSMTEEERDAKLLAIGQVRAAQNKLPSSMIVVEDKKEAIELLIIKKELQDKNKDVAPELISEEDKNQIKKINLELLLLSGKQANREITIEDQKRMVEMVDSLGDMEAKAYETTEEAQAAWDAVVDKYASENRINGIDLSKLDEKERAVFIQKQKDGFDSVNANILYLKNGGEAVVLNNDVASKGGSIDAVAANHEVLHAVLRRAIGTDQKAFEKIYNVLDPYLKQNLSDNVYAALALRFADKKQTKEFDEYLTAIGELMRTGHIKYNKSFREVAQSLGTMIANFFRKLFGSKTIPDTFRFDITTKDAAGKEIYDAKKVFNFLKSYQRAYNTGGEQAQIFADEINAQIVADTGEGRASSASESTVASEGTLYENVEEIYSQFEDGKIDKSTAGFMIGELYKNEIESRIDNGFIYNRNLYQPTRWDGWNEQVRQDVIVDMQFGSRGIKNLVENYDKIANTGVTLPAYINTYFNVRLFDVLPNDLVGANVSIETLTSADQLIAEETTIESDDKVRVLKSFSDFNLLSDTVVKDVKDRVIKIIQDLYTDNQNISPEFILETIEKLINSEVRNMIKASTGTIEIIDGKTVVSPEYTKFIDEIYNGAMESLSVDVIKRKFSRAKKSPFIVKRRPGKKGKEKVKKVNPETGKVTYYEKGIFDIKSRGKGAWGSFFTSLLNKYTTLRERQNSITTEIASALVQKSINDFSSDPNNLKQLTPDQDINAAVGVKNVLDNIAEQIDRKLGEQKTFDSFRSSTSTVRNLPIEAQAAVAAALRSRIAIKYVAESKGSMLNVVENIFAGRPDVLTQTRIELVASELQEIYDSVVGKPKDVDQLEGYDLNDFLANKLESKSEVATYKTLFAAFGYDANFDFDNKDDIEKARRTLNIIARKVGREFFELYLAPGFTAPSKISKGQYIPDGLNIKENLLYKKGVGIKKVGFWRYGTGKKDIVKAKNEKEALKLAKEKSKNKKLKLKDISQAYRSNDQRYGVIESVEDLEKNILKGVRSKALPAGLEYSNPGYTKAGKINTAENSLLGQQKFSDWFFTPPAKGTMYTEAQQAAIREAGLKSKKAYDYLIKKLRTLGPAGNRSITSDTMLFLFKAMNAQTNAITRTAAELGYLPDGEFNETMVLEHVIQAVTMNVIALDHVLAKKASNAFDLTLKDYKTTYLPESYDNMINQYYKQTMPYYWKPGMTGMVRYYNIETAGDFMLNMIDLDTGKVYGEEFANTIDYKKAPSYIKGKATVIERYNKLITVSLENISMKLELDELQADVRPTKKSKLREAELIKKLFETGKKSEEAAKIRLKISLNFIKQLDKVLKFNNKTLNSSRSSESTSRFFWRKKILSTKPTKGRSLSPRNILTDISEGKSRFPLPSKMFDQDGKELTGLAKIKFQLEENAEILRLPTELKILESQRIYYQDIELNAQIKRVEELEMNAYADELRAEIKKAEGQYKEDLELALEEKFAPAWIADAVKIAGLDIKTGKTFRSSESSKNQELSTIDGTIKEARRLDAIVSQYRKDYFQENYPYRSSESTASMNEQFNTILEETTNVGAEKVYSRARARSEGGKKGWSFIMDPTAEDFKGLLYSFIGKGKQGERQLKFFNDTLFRPFAQGVSSIDKARQALSNDYRALLQQYPNIKKILSEDSGYGNFTIDHAVRVYLFNKAGFEIPGLSKRDLAALNKIVESNPVLLAFAQDLSRVTKQEKGYIEPGELWLAGNIASDLEDVTKRIGRKQYLETWIKNKNEIFSEDNLNKIEALYGTDFRNSLVEILHRMETGTNRSFSDSKNKIADTWMNWVNNSVGAIMFVNVRSAVLQTISMFNFINFSDNNIYAAAKAFGNQNQFWEDFTFLFNSDFLKQRRSGLQQDLNAAELTTYLAHQKNKAKALLNYLLKKGFLPTQIADSFAIASGGATFYRNRINTLMKQGMTKAEAEAEAMLQWRELSEEAQQSSRPDKISSQQAGPLGRFILAFANTPMQYTRLQKRAIQDLLNGRGDWKENMGKILYYGFVQNLIFNALQQALFAVLFDDDDELDPKGGRVINGMADSLLRGLGIYGAAVSAGKNMILEFIRQSKKSRPDYQSAALQSLSISPPLSSKINKLRSASKTWQYNKDDIMREGLSLDNPAYIAVGKVVSAFTNLPLDRLFIKIDNLRTATEEETEFWQSIALVLGWDQWGLGLNPYSSQKSSSSNKRRVYKSKTY